MTTAEIFLSAFLGLFSAKEIWNFLRNRTNKRSVVELAEIKADRKSIEHLKSNYSELKANYRVMEMNYKELKISFSVMLPALEKLVSDDPTLMASFQVMKKYFVERD